MPSKPQLFANRPLAPSISTINYKKRPLLVSITMNKNIYIPKFPAIKYIMEVAAYETESILKNVEFFANIFV